MQSDILKHILLAEAFYNLGNDLQELGQFERAIDNYRRALVIYPNYVEAHNNLGNVLRDLDQTNEALASFRRALEINPNFAEAHSNLGNALRDLDQLDDAVASYRRALEIKPDCAEIHFNLGKVLQDLGLPVDAVASYRSSLDIKPDSAVTQCSLGNVLLDIGNLSAAEKHFNIALSLNSELEQVHQGLACIFQRLGNEEISRFHRDEGFKNNPLSTLRYLGRNKPVQLLVLGSALEGNLPWRFLIDSNVFQTSILAVEYFDEYLPLPPHHLILNAIGDADICQHGLKIACRLIEKSDAPIINPPATVIQTGRLNNAQRLRIIPGVVTPHMALVSKADLISGNISKKLTDEGLTFPLLLRPPGFHRGNYFVRIDSIEALTLAAEKLPGEHLLAIEFIDARSADNLFRKYRVMFINGSLYPIHMAISTQWMVHYFSSDMDKNDQFRNEEDAFLNSFSSFLGADTILVLEKISKTIGLDYCGIDFGINKNGNILLYEANSTMLINSLTNEKKWDYRRQAINNALAATKRILIERILLTSSD